MQKLLMNEAERFLLEHWAEARLLEESMEAVRTKYKDVFRRIIEAVTAKHPELDAKCSYPTQFWGDGSIACGRKSWPGESDEPSGFWVQSLRLELLAEEDSDPPNAFIWVSKKSNVDLDSARVILNKEKNRLLTPEELNNTSEGSGDILLWLPAPSKRELLGALSEGDGKKFVDLLVSQFDLMSRFVPAMDTVFEKCLRKE